MIRGLIVGLFVGLVAFIHPASAADVTATSCNAADVQRALDAAVDGDRVIIPPGTCTWTGTLFITKAISLTGSGTMPAVGAATSGGTVINVNAADSNVRCTLCWNEATTGHIVVSNIKFVVGPTAIVPGFGVILWSPTMPGGKIAVVHHITMEYHQGQERALLNGAGRGVIYRSLFTNDPPGIARIGNTGPSIQCKMSSPLADNNWASASTMGDADVNGDKNFYVETNTFANMGSAIDIDDGCKAVIRFNTFIDATHNDHGHDTSFVGVLHYEIYNNTYECVNPWNMFAFYGSRGGTGVIADNVMPNNCYGRSNTRIAATIQVLRRGPNCYRGPYPWLRQEGWGWGGSGGITNQTLEPLYIWNNKNTAGGTLGEADEYVVYDAPFSPACSLDNSSQTSAGYIRVNREYFLGVPKPGYRKFRYPHPFATGVPAHSNFTVR